MSGLGIADRLFNAAGNHLMRRLGPDGDSAAVPGSEHDGSVAHYAYQRGLAEGQRTRNFLWLLAGVGIGMAIAKWK